MGGVKGNVGDVTTVKEFFTEQFDIAKLTGREFFANECLYTMTDSNTDAPRYINVNTLFALLFLFPCLYGNRHGMQILDSEVIGRSGKVIGVNHT